MKKIDITIIGTIVDIEEEKHYDSGARMQKCIVALENNGHYNYYPIDFWNDRIERYLSVVGIGEEVRFRCSLNGGKVERDGIKFYPLSLYCWGCKPSDEPTTNGKEETGGQKITKRESEAELELLEKLEQNEAKTKQGIINERNETINNIDDDLPF